jgi:predicted acylesterase/phospholipase RssA
MSGWPLIDLERITEADGVGVEGGIMSSQSNEGAPADRFCDLVMKGGITSGVVYPPAICALAQEYRFKNIGGTSAGAIAAAVTAAAEYRRRMTGSLEGFKLLAELPQRLGTADETGKTQLLRLFQPDHACRRLFGILVSSLNAGGTFRRIAAVLFGCLVSYWIATSVSIVAAVGIYLATHSGWITGISFVVILLVLIGLWIYIDFTRGVVGNNYGLCKGLTTRERYGEALTPWLYKLIQDAAGLPLDEPLAFRHLWSAEGFPPANMEIPDALKDQVRSIDLQMFTTNLSHGRPYIFPHLETKARLFFNSAELAAYLPEPVIKWMDAKAIEYTEERRSAHSDPPIADAIAKGLREIPEPGDFPVLLAARMSLSFPILFSAVPLWAIDYEDPRGDRRFQRCLFSDGGISSNFPVHLFDGLLPQWPTFGITLEPALPSLPKSLIFLPHVYIQGIADRWIRFDQAEQSASKLGGFLMSIVSTMQNWNDNTVSRMPGVRDRVVRLRLKDQEGGMNLNMPAKLIETIAERGGAAGQVLIDRYVVQNGGPAGNNGTWGAWDGQRWVRLDVLVRTLADKSFGLTRSLGDGVAHATPYSTLLQYARAFAPPGHDDPLTNRQAESLQNLLKALGEVSVAFEEHAEAYDNVQTPNPDLRVRPSL